MVQLLNITSRHYLRILSSLQFRASAIARLVGGCVRDAYLGNASFDVDIATNLLPQQVMSIFMDQYDIRVIPTGIKYGTVSLFIFNERFEITTLRSDISSDGRRANVIFTDDFEKDALRRDFTINALSYCPFEDVIYDYFAGIRDLNERKVKFIGDPKLRIQEDYLRILRFFRFSASYAKELDIDGLYACIELKEYLSQLSSERIKSEMDKLLKQAGAIWILYQMQSNGILRYIFPFECNVQSLQLALDFISKNSFQALVLSTKYAILLYNNRNITRYDLNKLKFSRQEASKILDILHFCEWCKTTEVYFALKQVLAEHEDYLQYIASAVSVGVIGEELAKAFILKFSNVQPVFPVTGNDLIRIHIREGEQLGQVIKHLKCIWIKSDFKLTKNELLETL